MVTTVRIEPWYNVAFPPRAPVENNNENPMPLPQGFDPLSPSSKKIKKATCLHPQKPLPIDMLQMKFKVERPAVNRIFGVTKWACKKTENHPSKIKKTIKFAKNVAPEHLKKTQTFKSILSFSSVLETSGTFIDFIQTGAHLLKLFYNKRSSMKDALKIKNLKADLEAKGEEIPEDVNDWEETNKEVNEAFPEEFLFGFMKFSKSTIPIIELVLQRIPFKGLQGFLDYYADPYTQFIKIALRAKSFKDSRATSSNFTAWANSFNKWKIDEASEKTAPENASEKVPLISRCQELLDKRKANLEEKLENNRAVLEPLLPTLIEKSKPQFNNLLKDFIILLETPYASQDEIQKAINELTIVFPAGIYSNLEMAGHLKKIQDSEAEYIIHFENWALSKNPSFYLIPELDRQESLCQLLKGTLPRFIEEKKLLEKKFIEFKAAKNNVTIATTLISLFVAKTSTGFIAGGFLVFSNVAPFALMALGIYMAQSTSIMDEAYVAYYELKSSIKGYYLKVKQDKLIKTGTIVEELKALNPDDTKPRSPIEETANLEFKKAFDDVQVGKDEFDALEKKIKSKKNDIMENDYKSFLLHVKQPSGSNDFNQFDACQKIMMECNFPLMDTQLVNLLEKQMGINLEELEKEKISNPDKVKKALMTFFTLKGSKLDNFMNSHNAPQAA
ncbi:MAG: hypothetical protein H0W88_12610 [Parachlamydiaceae bacterium]|nr:hypothetical protein [Parachlamydiaceae bacterium]